MSPGERYRFRGEAGIRITTTRLAPDWAPALAAAISEAVQAGSATCAG